MNRLSGKVFKVLCSEVEGVGNSFGLFGLVVAVLFSSVNVVYEVVFL